MTADWDPGTLLLPERTRLVHIGPPKTGTTMLQTAFHNGREAIAPQGVRFAGTDRHPMKAVLSAIGRPGPISRVPPSIDNWKRLVRDIERAGDQRVLLSSEFLADATPEAVRRVVDDLDPARVHVAVTLRPLASILPSQWQQYVQSGIRASYDTWLKAVFDTPDPRMTPSFWHRHRHDRLVERWAEVVGPANVTVVVLDDRDHDMVLRVFEALLGLRQRTLEADDDRTNRSMTLPEIEAVRAFNARFYDEGLKAGLHALVMRTGASTYIKSRIPEPDEQRITTPAWAVERTTVVAREMVAAIAASGVRVVGDLGSLTRPPSRVADGEAPEVAITPTVAASVAMGILISSGLVRGTSGGQPRSRSDADDLGEGKGIPAPSTTTEPFELLRVSTSRLSRVLARRLRAAAKARVRGIRVRLS